jgi:hypothetical protein
MQGTPQRTQSCGSKQWNAPVDWNFGIQHSVALLYTQLRNVGGHAIDSMQPDISRNKSLSPVYEWTGALVPVQ